jgi:hypothetical protein
MNLPTLAKVGMLGSVVALCGYLAWTLPNGRPQVVSGYVQCASGARAVGVWVEAVNGGSGWGTTRSVSGHPERTWYTRLLPLGGRFAVHVGCGGSSAHWGSSSRSEDVSGPVRDFLCHDPPHGEGPTAVCEAVHVDG